MACVTVDVEVDLDEFEDHELVTELKHRGYFVFGDGDSPALDTDIQLQKLFDAAHLGNDRQLKEVVKEMAWSCAGRIIN